MKISALPPPAPCSKELTAPAIHSLFAVIKQKDEDDERDDEEGEMDNDKNVLQAAQEGAPRSQKLPLHLHLLLHARLCGQ